MIKHIPYESLGAAEFGWLSARHHFSFGHYRDPDRMGVGALRVWNDDEIAAGTGFSPHPHRDMEIVTYVREGAITHEDSLGNKGRTEAGDVQVMSAGTGIVHGEFNREETLTRLFQIWFLPRSSGGDPWWDTRKFPERAASTGFQPLASGFPEDRERGAIPINSDAGLSAASLGAGDEVELPLPADAAAYLVVSEGKVRANDVVLNARDALQVADERSLRLTALEPSDVLLAVLKPT